MGTIDCLSAMYADQQENKQARAPIAGAQSRRHGGLWMTLAVALAVSLGAQAKQSDRSATAVAPQALTDAAIVHPSGFVLPPALAKDFPVDGASCFMGPESITINTTQWKAYACSDYRSLILSQSWANGETYVFVLTTKGGDVFLSGTGQAPAEVIAKAQQSLKALKVGGLVDMTSDVVAAWRTRAAGR